MNKQTKNILIGCTGSVATIKIPQIVQAFLNIQTDFNVNFAVRLFQFVIYFHTLPRFTITQ